MTGTHRWVRAVPTLFALALAGALPAAAAAQAGPVVTLSRGTSTVLTTPNVIERISIGDPEVADAVAVSPREILLTGRGVGTTSLIVWDASQRRVYDVEVGVDAAALERQIREIFPNEGVRVSATGSTVILQGSASTGTVARRIVELAGTTGATIIDYLNAPPAQQVQVRVQFAEVSRSIEKNVSADFFAGNPQNVGPLDGVDWLIENTVGELLRVSLLDDDAEIELLLRALKERGLLRILAEPTLLALDGEEATFLAGGEFPYTVAQPAGNAVIYTVVFKEFGVNLRFRPRVTASGNIRMDVAPSVSQLDFGNAVNFSGATFPALRTRRTETAVELRPGQTLAIAGLLDNQLARNVSKIPILGDLPILGLLFRSESYQQERTELVVLVTPELVDPAAPAGPLPPGDPSTWEWESSLRNFGTRQPARMTQPAPAPSPR